MSDTSLRILLAAPRGFCAGVDRAIEIVERALELFDAPIYVRHEIVHNKHVVDRLRQRGVIFVDDVEEVPDDAVAIFSAHGVSKAVRKQAAERPMRVIDATCPLVTKVHLEVHKLDRDGFEIILIGHAGHIEVEGTMGQLPEGRIKLVQNPKEVAKVKVTNPDRVAYVTQTTLSLDETKGVVAALKTRFPNLLAPRKDDICYATQNRQNTVKRMVGEIDLLIVIGSKNSSNSNRLVEVARLDGVTAHLIDEPSEIESKWLEEVKTVGLTAGASAPEDLVQATVKHLLDMRGGTVEPYDHIHEDVEFQLPRELVQVQR